MGLIISRKRKKTGQNGKYVDTIIEIQPQGSYTLLGYSAGEDYVLKPRNYWRNEESEYRILSSWIVTVSVKPCRMKL